MFHTDRNWMYERYNLFTKNVFDRFISGMKSFVEFARVQHEFMSEENIRCPCQKCKNWCFYDIETVKLHLFRHGFLANYYIWTSHGELLQFQAPPLRENQISSSQGDESHVAHISSVSGTQPETPWDQRMLGDFFAGYVPPVDTTNCVPQATGHEYNNVSPNVNDVCYLADQFHNVLQAADQPLYEGCQEGSQLQFVAEAMSIKSDFNVPRDEVNRWLELFGRYLPRDHTTPQNYYETKKLTSNLGLPVINIDACRNGCMLFLKGDKELKNCSFCGEHRYKLQDDEQCTSKRRNWTAFSVLRFLPLTPRLQRLYASRQTAEEMKWHAMHEEIGNLMGHPCDSEAWKHIDMMYPDFASEPRNVRLDLCSDGFVAHGKYGASYSCWPVILTTYNLPPGMCMKYPYMFLSLIIPGPICPKKKIDVY
ncbi:unnamed protein product [Cuscuta epithymum]|uniref:Transposase-associated domain-containing protein n=1 Tax=Cuscuta epithymum TaxID=186058 RepID=A0AAV0GF71_9ASTE|nr:unnamed protein product [Cuscuta epithymum]